MREIGSVSPPDESGEIVAGGHRWTRNWYLRMVTIMVFNSL